MKTESNANHANTKIALLTTGLSVGGAEQQVVLLAEQLTTRGYEVEVITMLPEGTFVPRLSRTVAVRDLGMRRGVPDPRAVFRLAAHLRRFQPHVLHCHQVHANLLGRLTRLIAPVPVLISTAHSFVEGGRMRSIAYRLTDCFCDLTTQVSRAGLDRYTRKGLVPLAKCAWYPNGIDLDHFVSDNPDRGSIRSNLGWSDRFVFLAVGNFREEKDYPNMLRAFASLEGKEGTILAVAGEGALRADLSAMVTELGIGDCVQLLGLRSDVKDLMGAADAYVMSSSAEGSPIALLEAAACGLPVVVTDVGGNSDLVVDGVTGALVPPGDSEALGRAMARMRAKSVSERKRMGVAGRQLISSIHGSASVVDRWENLYAQLMETRSQSSKKGFRWLPASW